MSEYNDRGKIGKYEKAPLAIISIILILLITYMLRGCYKIINNEINLPFIFQINNEESNK